MNNFRLYIQNKRQNFGPELQSGFHPKLRHPRGCWSEESPAVQASNSQQPGRQLACSTNGIFLHCPSALETMPPASSCEELRCGWGLQLQMFNLHERRHTDSNIHDGFCWRFLCCFYCFVCLKYHPSWCPDPDARIMAREKLTIIFNFKDFFFFN